MAMSVYLAFGLLLLGICHITAIEEEELRKMAKLLHNDCVAETGVDEALVFACKTGDFADDPKLKCYMKCMLTTISFMDDDGEIDVDTALSMAPEKYRDIMEPILRTCGTVKGADDCETAFLTNKCWQATAPDKYGML